jgi:hypothetical protein
MAQGHNDIVDRIKSLSDEWGKDILAGVGFSSFATWFKYVYHHFIDIGWTVMAALAVMVATHYGKKILKGIDERFNKWLKRNDK